MTSLWRDDVMVPIADVGFRDDHLVSGERDGAGDSQPDNACTDH